MLLRQFKDFSNKIAMEPPHVLYRQPALLWIFLARYGGTDAEQPFSDLLLSSFPWNGCSATMARLHGWEDLLVTFLKILSLMINWTSIVYTGGGS